MAPQKIRHVSSVHSIRDPRIFHKQCKSLAALGYDVGLVACHDRAEVIDGVRIVPIARPKGRLDRMARVGRKLYHAAVRERADVYHLHDPELLWVGALLKLRGFHVIYDVHEDVPKQVMSKHWIPRWARPLVAKVVMLVERLAAGIVDGIVAATPSIARKFPPAKTVVVQNFPEASFRRLDGADPAAHVAITADSDRLLGLTSAPLRFGLPDPFDARGRAVLRDVLSGRIRIRGILTHPRRLARLSALLSVA